MAVVAALVASTGERAGLVQSARLQATSPAARHAITLRTRSPRKVIVAVELAVCDRLATA